MWIADDALLTDLARADPECVQTFIVRDARPQFHALVLSDIHLEAPDFTPNATKREERLNEVIRAFKVRCGALIDAFGEEKQLDLLINCGDSIRGRDAVEYSRALKDPLEAYKVLYGDFSLKALRELCTEYRITEVLSIPGNHDVYRQGAIREDVAAGTILPRYRPYYRSFARGFVRREIIEESALSRPCLFVGRIQDHEAATVPLAYVAIIGFDSNQAEYHYSYVANYGRISQEQLDAVTEKILPALAQVAVDAPLYVLGVMHHHLLPVGNLALKGDVDRGRTTLLEKATQLQCISNSASGGEGAEIEIPEICATNQTIAMNGAKVTTNASQLIQFFQEQRFSLVIHGHMHQKAIYSVSRLQFRNAASEEHVTILGCPSFDAKTDGYKGILRLGLDLNAGEVEVVCTDEPHDPEDAGGVEKTVQVSRPLVSASRVGSAEMRLYRAIKAHLRDAPERQDPSRQGEFKEFEEYIDENMKEHGYVPVCHRSGRSLTFLKPLQRRRYFLLLLLKSDGGNVSVLLSRHKPLRLSPLAEWDTLLMPAFTSVRELLHHFIDDIHRQYLETADYASEAQRIKNDVDELRGFLTNENLKGIDHWLRYIRVVSSPRSFIKFSPTDGMPTEYEYTFVTLEPFVSAAGEDEYRRFRAFMRDMPRIAMPSDPVHGPYAIPMDSVGKWGSGLRPNPDSNAAGKGNKQEKYKRELPFGALWFPVGRSGGSPEELWRECPSIVARNADVMTWLIETLGDLRKGGDFPLAIRLGEKPAVENYRIMEQFPFERDTARPKHGGQTNSELSTREALSQVTYEPSFDLADVKAFGGRDIRKVLLMKSEAERDPHGRRMIEVFEIDGGGEVGAKLGVLRPVQRYVLEYGLERARSSIEQVFDKLRDPWGFAKVAVEGSKEVSMIPPILDEIDAETWEGETPEFILCDGNHRVVQRVWIEDKPLPAVAVLGKPHEPYYAHPFSKFEWYITADNKLVVPPDTPSKYAPRRVSAEYIETLPPRAQQILLAKPETERFRRCFRDLSTGFGYMGGQGGRFA